MFMSSAGEVGSVGDRGWAGKKVVGGCRTRLGLNI